MSSAATTIDEHTLSTLEPEERAALEDPEYSAQQQETLKALAAEAPADDETDAGEGGEGEVLDADGRPVAASPAPATAVEAPAAAPAAAAAAPAAAPAPAAAADDDDDEPFVSTAYQFAKPQDYDDQVAQLKADSDALVAKLKAGEVDAEGFATENSKLLERRDELAKIAIKAELAEETSAQEAGRLWSAEISKLFRTAAKTDGIDYSKDEVRRADLDTFVKALSQNPATNDWPMRRFLEEAHKRVKALHGVGAAAPAPAPAPAAAAAPAAAPAAPSRKPPVAAAPKTLADVPGSDGPGDLAGEFADIDRLEGDELEDALKKMSPAQIERYKRGL